MPTYDSPVIMEGFRNVNLPIDNNAMGRLCIFHLGSQEISEMCRRYPKGLNISFPGKICENQEN